MRVVPASTNSGYFARHSGIFWIRRAKKTAPLNKTDEV